MKRVNFLIVILFTMSLFQPAYSQMPAFNSTTVNIAGWNLSGFTAISRDKAATFAEAINYIDPEILVLTEVNPDFIASEIVAELNQMDICYQRIILDQTANQNISILYKCGVEVANPTLIDGSDDNNSHLRKALAAEVKVGEFDFILIALHLKAGRSNADRQIRDRQNSAIASYIGNATAGAEKDVLIIGDYNMITGDDQSNFNSMNPNNFLNFISDSLANQFSHISTSGPGNLLDGYAISRVHTTEYINRSIRIVPMYSILNMALLQYRNTVSDHLVIEANFRISRDDD